MCMHFMAQISVVSQEDTTATDDDAMDTEEPGSSNVEMDQSRKCINLYNTIILLL